jgi:predicted membrane protein
MIIFTVIGILTAIFFFVVIMMSIIETRIKNRTKEKLFWNMDKLETLTDSDLIDEIQRQ